MESDPHLTLEQRRQIIEQIPTVSTIDSCKENIQPRKSGRSVASLTTIFDLSPEEREHELALGNKKFEEELDTLDEQDDPLNIYIQYIEWIHTMYPQGQNSESNLVSILSDATHQFKSDTRYKSDPRYLKLWIEYSAYVNEPKDIFTFLIREDIGQTLTLFYEEYSTYYERSLQMEQAMKVYEVGIERSAEPVKRLHKSFKLLQSRIREREQRGLLRREQQEAQTQINELRQHGRTMLGHKFDSRSRSSVPANVYAGIEASTSINPISRSRTFGNDRPSSPSSSSVSASASASNNILLPSSSFSVYVEPTSTPSSPNITTTFPRASSSSNNNPHISSAPHQRLENQRPIERFSGATLPQAQIVQDQPQASFQVYQDDDEETVVSSSNNRSFERSDSMLSISNGEESQISKIKRNPTSDNLTHSKRLKQDGEVIKSKKEMLNRFNTRKNLYLRSQNTKGEVEYIAFLSSIKKEMSVEEYRVLKKRLSTGPLNAWDDYSISTKKEEENKVPDLTTETINAMNSVAKLFDEPTAYNEEEEDLTWNNPVQRFTTTYHPPANENE